MLYSKKLIIIIFGLMHWSFFRGVLSVYFHCRLHRVGGGLVLSNENKAILFQQMLPNPWTLLHTLRLHTTIQHIVMNILYG